MLGQIGAYLSLRGLGIGLVGMLLFINNNEKSRNQILGKKKALNSGIICYYSLIVIDIIGILMGHSL